MVNFMQPAYSNRKICHIYKNITVRRTKIDDKGDDKGSKGATLIQKS